MRQAVSPPVRATAPKTPSIIQGWVSPRYVGSGLPAIIDDDEAVLDKERPSPAHYQSPEQRYHSFLEQSSSEPANDPRAIVKSISFHAPAPCSRSRRESDSATSTLPADGVVAPMPAERVEAKHSNGARTAQKLLPHRSNSYKIGDTCARGSTSVAAPRALDKSPSIGAGSPLQPTARTSNAGLASPLTSHPTARSRNFSARSQGAASVSSNDSSAATSPPTQSRHPAQSRTHAAAAHNGKGAASPPATAMQTRRRLHSVPSPSAVPLANGSPSPSSVALSPSGPATPAGSAIPLLYPAASSPAASPGAPGRPSPAAGRPPVPPRVQLTTVSAPTLRVQWDNLEGPDTDVGADGSTEVWRSQHQLAARGGAGGATAPGMQQGGARGIGGSSWAGGPGGKRMSEGGSVLAGDAASPPLAASTSSGGTLADLDAVAPRVGVRPPRWLKPSAFQVVEKLRTGKLQELVDRLVAVSAPTILDLGGLEFSGAFTAPSAGPAAEPSTFSFAPAPAPAPALSLEPSYASANGLVSRGPAAVGSLAGGRSGASLLGSGMEQVVAVPPGQHVTLYNATLLLAAEQYILVGQGASLLLKGVEVLGCSRDAALASAAMRRRALSSAAAAAAASAAPASRGREDGSGGGGGGLARTSASGLPVAGGAGAAGGGRTSMPAVGLGTGVGAGSAAVVSKGRQSTSGIEQQVQQVLGGGGAAPPRRVSTPGLWATGAGGDARRGSTSGQQLPVLGGPGGGAGGGTGVGAGLEKRRTSISGGKPFVLTIPPPGEAAGGVAAVTGLRGGWGGLHELVDPREAVDEHALVEVQGGYARVTNCRLWPGRRQVALCVSEGGGCEVADSTVSSCCAAGHRTTLVAENGRLGGGGGAGCVSVLAGANASLAGCTLAEADGDAVEAHGPGSVAVLAECEVRRAKSCAVSATTGALVHLVSVRAASSGMYGIYAHGDGTAVYGKDVHVEDSGRSGLCVTDAGAVRLTSCTVEGSVGGPGVVVQPAAVAAAGWGRRHGATGGRSARSSATGTGGSRVASSTGEGDGGGVGEHGEPCGPASRAVLVRCAVAANAGQGVHVLGGCSAEVSGCEVYNNQYCGLQVEGAGSGLTALGTRLITNEQAGVRVADGAAAAMVRCYLTHNGRDGVSLEDPGSSARLSRCESRDNRESGLCVTGSASVELAGCRLAGNQHDGLAVGGVGSTAWAAACNFQGNVAKGVGVYMGAVCLLQGCASHGNGMKAAQVGDEGSRLLLGPGCTFDRQPVLVNGGVIVKA